MRDTIGRLPGAQNLGNFSFFFIFFLRPLVSIAVRGKSPDRANGEAGSAFYLLHPCTHALYLQTLTCEAGPLIALAAIDGRQWRGETERLCRGLCVIIQPHRKGGGADAAPEQI